MKDIESLRLFQGNLASQRRWKDYPKPRVFKRVIDLAVCILLLPILLIVIPVISLLITLESKGPAIFVQERIGWGGRRFRIYKFRTMLCKRSKDE